jgi:lauroyl/myristoyl acyltransferase
MVQAIPYHLGAFFARFTPDWFCRAIAWTLAEVNWRLRPATRRTVAENLRVIHPEWSDSQRRTAARRVVHHFARSILLFLQLPFLDPDRLFARIDMSALRRELDALGEGQPFIVATAHVGPWELGGFALTRLGRTVHTVALDHRSARVTQFYSERRGSASPCSVSRPSFPSDTWCCRRAARRRYSPAYSYLTDRTASATFTAEPTFPRTTRTNSRSWSACRRTACATWND